MPQDVVVQRLAYVQVVEEEDDDKGYVTMPGEGRVQAEKDVRVVRITVPQDQLEEDRQEIAEESSEGENSENGASAEHKRKRKTKESDAEELYRFKQGFTDLGGKQVSREVSEWKTYCVARAWERAVSVEQSRLRIDLL